jgi:hypothetical protein
MRTIFIEGLRDDAGIIAETAERGLDLGQAA